MLILTPPSSTTETFCRAIETRKRQIRLEIQYPGPKVGALNGNLLARDRAGLTCTIPRELTHAWVSDE